MGCKGVDPNLNDSNALLESIEMFFVLTAANNNLPKSFYSFLQRKRTLRT